MTELQQQDRDDLTEAAKHVHAVLDRHDQDMTLPALTALCEALRELRFGSRLLGLDTP